MNMTKKLLTYLLVPLLLAQAIGCKSNSTGTAPNYFFDPKIPGGSLGGNITVNPVSDLVADTSVSGQVTLTWKVDPLYYPLSYRVRIYKHANNGAAFSLPDPTQLYTAANLYQIADIGNDTCPIETSANPPSVPYFHNTTSIPGNCNTFVDNVKIYSGSQYNYWVYLYLNNVWSLVAATAPTTPADGTTFKIPAATSFWNNKTWSMGGSPYSNGVGSTRYLNDASLEPRQTGCQLQISQNTCTQVTGCSWTFNSANSSHSCSNELAIGNMKGKSALGLNGSLMYVADTDNNRIVVYTRGEALACVPYKTTDPTTYQACMFSAEGFPFEPANVLGQPTQKSSDPCNVSCQAQTQSASCGATTGCSWDTTKNTCNPTFSYDQCLTKPNYVTVKGNQLIISDSGNNRLVVWNHLPGDPSYTPEGGQIGSATAGCDPNVIVGQTRLTDCKPDYQIGKKSFSDFTQYNLSTDGNQTFNKPTGTLVDGADLYIADTGNNRVVKIKNYEDSQSFSCNPTNWGTPLCEFSSVLGQASFFVNRSFQDFFNDDIQNQLQCSAQSLPASSGPGGTKASCQATAVGCTWMPGQIAGQGTCSLTHPLRSNLGIGNVIGSQYSYVLQRYFTNPTVVKISSGRLLVSSNENFQTVSTVNSPIYLKARILEWGNNPLGGDTPTCNATNFNSGGCDASIVFGQSNFTTLVSVQGATGKYTDVSYGLESLDDFDISGKSMVGVDSINNFVYLWSDWTANSTPGNPPTGVVSSPIIGSVYNGQPLPVLKGLGAITLDPDNFLIYVTDASGYNVYEVKGY
jgi:hypothetical protein